MDPDWYLDAGLRWRWALIGTNLVHPEVSATSKDRTIGHGRSDTNSPVLEWLIPQLDRNDVHAKRFHPEGCNFVFRRLDRHTSDGDQVRRDTQQATPYFRLLENFLEHLLRLLDEVQLEEESCCLQPNVSGDQFAENQSIAGQIRDQRLGISGLLFGSDKEMNSVCHWTDQEIQPDFATSKTSKLMCHRIVLHSSFDYYPRPTRTELLRRVVERVTCCRPSSRLVN